MEIKLSKNEIEALKNGVSRKQATVLLRLLNRICKTHSDPKKRSCFKITTTKCSGYKFEEQYSNAKQMETYGRAGAGFYTCITGHGQQVFGDKNLCGHLRNKILNVSSINIEEL